MGGFDALLADLDAIFASRERLPTQREVRFFDHQPSPPSMLKSLNALAAENDRSLAVMSKAVAANTPSRATLHDRVKTTLAKAFSAFQRGELSAVQVSALEAAANRRHAEIEQQHAASAEPLAKSLGVAGPSREQINGALMKARSAGAISAVGISQVEAMLNQGKPLPPAFSTALGAYL